MPRKNDKNFYMNDDRPSRFLVDLKPNPLHIIEQPVKKQPFLSFLQEIDEEEIEYTQPRKRAPEPIRQEKKKEEEKEIVIHRSFVYKFFSYFYKLFFYNPKKAIKKSWFTFRHHFKKKHIARTATPGSRALMNSSFEVLNEEISKFTKKKALAFSLALFALILPLKGLSYVKDIYDFRGRVLGASEEAVEEFKGAAGNATNLNFDQAAEDFTRASSKFMDARNEIGIMSKFLSVLGTVVPNDDIKMAKNATLILDAGKLSADIGLHLSSAFITLEPDKEKNIKIIVNSFSEHTSEAARLAHELEEKVDKINVKYLPAEYQDQFSSLQGKAGLVADSLDEIVELLEQMKVFLGFQYDKRYLLVFQNNTELRASGGFIGSYALIDFRNGEIKKLEVPGGGSYDTEAGLKRQIVAPYPLQMVNPLWHFWDSNWWPDWPTTARKLMWFYDKSDGPSVDGVISFTPTVFEKILSAIGPVDMTEKYGVEINADNFWIETQKIAETKPATTTATTTKNIAEKNTDKVASTTETVVTGRHEPKKIIGDLMNKIIEELPKRLDKEMFVNLTGVVEDSMKEKHVMFYFSDAGLQAKTVSYGWDGSMKRTAFDYLMVVNTNVAGGKTDKVIRETISHQAELQRDGSIIDTVTIKREHTGEKWQEFTGVRNNNWMRVYVPQGSELIEAQGFSTPDESFFSHPEADWEKDVDVEKTEGKAKIDIRSGTKIYVENEKTVFANWSQIDPGQTAEIVLRYRLPFKVEKIERPDTIMNRIGAWLSPEQKDLVPYALMVQKQPGTLGSGFNSVLDFPTNMKADWFYVNDVNNSSQGWDYSTDLKTDKYWATLLDIK